MQRTGRCKAASVHAHECSKAAVQAAGCRCAVCSASKQPAAQPMHASSHKPLPSSRVQQLQRLHGCCHHPWQQQRAAATLQTNQGQPAPTLASSMAAAVGAASSLACSSLSEAAPSAAAASACRREPGWQASRLGFKGEQGCCGAGTRKAGHQAAALHYSRAKQVQHAQLQPLLARCITNAQTRARATLQCLPPLTAPLQPPAGVHLLQLALQPARLLGAARAAGFSRCQPLLNRRQLGAQLAALELVYSVWVGGQASVGCMQGLSSPRRRHSSGQQQRRRRQCCWRGAAPDRPPTPLRSPLRPPGRRPGTPRRPAGAQRARRPS